MSKPVIRVENLGKRYVLGRQQTGTRYRALRDEVMEAVEASWRWAKRGFGSYRPPAQAEEFWALRDVCFEVGQGEVVGIIGRNGAGKSTLLKLLSRITEPTNGRIILKGRVASLLEVGTGFHPELTGRENIYLNGAILGMRRAEIKVKFDEIVAFAEVEKFLDTPVKRYSSGMYVRLAFAVAAHLEPEILIVDEVLAVGDAEFQRKCLGKMQDVARGEGRTVLFVSHNIPALRALCTRALVLRQGRLRHEGSVSSCIEFYTVDGSNQEGETWVRPLAEFSNHGPQPLTFEKISCTLEGKQPLLNLVMNIELRSRDRHKAAFIAVDILDASGAGIMQALPPSENLITSDRREHRLRLVVSLPPLIPGRYLVTAWVGSHNTETLDQVRLAVAFEVNASPVPGHSFPHSLDHGHIVPFSTVELCPIDFEPTAVGLSGPNSVIAISP